MTNPIQKLLSHDRSTFFAFAVLAALALATAYTSQYVYGLQPCTLCLYQRAPYFAVIILCVLGIAFGRSHPKAGVLLLGLTAGAFFLNAIFALYHSGVERHWWRSFLEGCTVPVMEGNITDVLAQIARTPIARCDEIPWTDPVIGLSMANYNVIVCLLLTIAALYSLKLSHRR